MGREGWTTVGQISLGRILKVKPAEARETNNGKPKKLEKCAGWDEEGLGQI